jgi:hypothetical protein
MHEAAGTGRLARSAASSALPRADRRAMVTGSASVTEAETLVGCDGCARVACVITVSVTKDRRRGKRHLLRRACGRSIPIDR